jgi:hypothetical protein
MKNGKLFEQIIWSDGENTVTLSRTMNANYDIIDGEIEIHSAGGDGDDYKFDGPSAEELEALLEDDDFVESETFEDLGLEQIDYVLEEAA